MRQNFKQKIGGFTLIEALVAVSIFSMSILGLLSILSHGIADTSYAKKRILAEYLTQEGVEYMRNMRDAFVLFDAGGHQAGWDAFKAYLTSSSAHCDLSTGCYFNDQDLDYTDPTQPMTTIGVIACGSSCPPLLYNSGKYSMTGGTDSGFIRQIKISQVSTDEIKVSATVSWTQASGTHTTTFSENLYNWLP